MRGDWGTGHIPTIYNKGTNLDPWNSVSEAFSSLTTLMSRKKNLIRQKKSKMRFTKTSILRVALFAAGTLANFDGSCTNQSITENGILSAQCRNAKQEVKTASIDMNDCFTWYDGNIIVSPDPADP